MSSINDFVIWGGDSVERVGSVDGMVSRIIARANALKDKCGICGGVDIIKDNGRLRKEPISDFDPSDAERMSIGIGNGKWMLFYYPGDGSLQNSIGDLSATGVSTFYFGDWTELSRKYLVSKDSALDTIRHWLQTGQLGNAVDWTSEFY